MRIELNGQPRDVEDGTTVADLVAELVDADPTGTAVAVGGEVVRRADWPTTRVAEDDRIEVVRAVQGG